MPVEDVFSISGRGTVATGRVETGQIRVNEPVDIVGMKDQIDKTVVTGVEMFRKLLEYGEAGDNIGCLLRGTKKDEIRRGQVLAKPGSIHPHKSFKRSGLCPLQRRRWSSYILPQWLSSSVLFPYNGRDWCRDA